MKYIGAHFSISRGFSELVETAESYGANSFALFTKPTIQWKGAIITESASLAFEESCKSHSFTPDAILPHASYLINMANPDEKKARKAKESFACELSRCKQLGLDKLNFHPGSYLDGSLVGGIKQIGKLVKEAMKEVPGVTPVFEIMAGQGTNIGYSLEQLRDLIACSDDSCGVCIDTCHALGAGYEFRTEETYNRFMDHFNQVIGLSHLRGFHLNDSKKPLGSRKDRHEQIGAGEIGLEAFRCIVRDPRTDNIPLILETPDCSLWRDEIALLKSFHNNNIVIKNIKISKFI